jgi:hypothetical protein
MPQYRFQPLTVGYDGTVYALVNFDFQGFQINGNASHLVALDAQRGTEKFRVPLPKGQFSVSGSDNDGSGTIPPENISRPMVLADGSINVAVSNRISTLIFSPNTHQAIPQNNSHDPNSSGPAIYCPSEILECWAPVDSSGTVMQKEEDSTEGNQISLVNIQPDGSYKQYQISSSLIECDQFGSHFTYVLDDALLQPFFHVGGTIRNGNGVPVSDGHQYAQEIFSWFTGTCGLQPFGPNGFDLMVVPNGTGGLLVASETDDVQNPVWIKNIPQPSVSGAGTEIHIAALNTINNLVIGENGNAFAAGSFNFFETPRLVSFNLASGASNWTYDATFHVNDFDPGYVDIVAAGPNNSLYAVEGGFFNVEPKVAFALDPNGVRTDNPTSNQEVTFVASAGIGSNTWLGANVTQIASLNMSALPFGMPFILQSSPPIGPEGITAYASNLITPTVSTYGAPSPEGKEGRPWYFVLVWQNDFTFTPDYPNRLPSLTTDITSDATVIKQAALKAMKDAYKDFWIVIVEGTPGTGDHRATVLNTQTLVAHSRSCGATNPNQPRESQVDYIVNMQNAQDALKVVINNSQDEAAALQRIDLLQAIGRGVGVTAAHELAHHFLFNCCAMDADPEQDPLARGAYNATGCSGVLDPSPWTGFWPKPVIKLHWEPATLRGLNECLSFGWRDFGSSSCHQ